MPMAHWHWPTGRSTRWTRGRTGRRSRHQSPSCHRCRHPRPRGSRICQPRCRSCHSPPSYPARLRSPTDPSTIPCLDHRGKHSRRLPPWCHPVSPQRRRGCRTPQRSGRSCHLRPRRLAHFRSPTSLSRRRYPRHTGTRSPRWTPWCRPRWRPVRRGSRRPRPLPQVDRSRPMSPVRFRLRKGLSTRPGNGRTDRRCLRSPPSWHRRWRR